MAFKKNNVKPDNFTFEVKEELATICETNGWELKIRLISWNGANPKYDIRKWKVDEDDNEKCGKGISLTGEEMELLTEALDKIYNE